MPNSNMADLISCRPGDYVFHRNTYEREEGFDFDLDVTRQFCESRGYFFSKVADPGALRPEAFFVHIRN